MQSLWMLAASLLFACMGVCVKLGSTQFSAAELAFYRSFVALLLIYGYMRYAGLSLVTAHWKTHITRSIAGFVSLVTYFSALSLIPLATAVTLNYTSPLFLALLLAFWQREAIRRLLLFALGGGFVGVALLLQPAFHSEQIIGGMFGLASGMVSSIAFLNVRKLGEMGEPEWRTVFYFSLIATIGGLPWALSGTSFHAIDARGASLLIGVGSFGALAQLCMTRAYGRGKTIATASLSYSTVAFASIFGIYLWDDHLPMIAWVGIVLIVVSGILTNAFSRPAPSTQA